MSEESIVAVLVAFLTSAFLPAILNKIKPKTELDSANIENALKLYEQLEKRFEKLEQKYDIVVEENDRLEAENDELKRKNRLYQGEIEDLKDRVAKLEDDLKRERNEI